MARPKKNVAYNADDAAIVRFFDRSTDAADKQKNASHLISSLNSEMESAGVHPGVMSSMRRIAKNPEGKRGWLIKLTQRYLKVLLDADRLNDPQVDIEDWIEEKNVSQMPKRKETAAA